MKYKDYLTTEGVENSDAFMKIAKVYAQKIAKDVSKMEKISQKMLVNDIYQAIQKATFNIR